MTRPLAGVRVCDLSQNLAGPFCSQILGDLGAEVIKVEPPGGDAARPWGPPFWGGDSTLFLSANRNKRSIMLDLKREEGRAILARLARRSDVFIQSSRSGVPERLGFDYERVRALRPDVIYLSVTAFGDRGPMKEQPGYDPLMQAYAGIMSVTGEADRPPVRAGASVVDFATGMWGAISILAALRARDATGAGANLTTALLDTAVGLVSNHLMGYLATGEEPGRMGTGLGSIAPYQVFETADGGVMIAAGKDAMFRRLCRALELPDLADDPRYRTNPDRVGNRETLVPILAERIARFSTDELVRAMREAGVPCSPVQDMAEVAADPQVVAAELLVPAKHAGVPDYRDVAMPFRVDGVRPHGEAPVPAVGEHTAEILEEMGFTASEIERLIEEGVAGRAAS